MYYVSCAPVLYPSYTLLEKDPLYRGRLFVYLKFFGDLG
jgi:hypothetical protein